MTRNYSSAMKEYEEELCRDNKNNNVIKKIIICYVRSGRIDKALELFYNLINEDIDLIIKTDPVKDDCPCPEIIYECENDFLEVGGKDKRHVALGILWLYCNIEQSFHYFKKAVQEFPGNNQLIQSFRIITHNLYKNLPINKKLT